MKAYRYTRQVRLAEIGDAGQDRIAQSAATVDADGLAGAVEARYLAGAGVGRIATLHDGIGDTARALHAGLEVTTHIGARPAHGEPPAFGVRDESAREVASGAWRALAHLRRVLRRGSEA